MLTDLDVRRAKGRDKQYKLSDSGGLFLLASRAPALARGRRGYGDERKVVLI